MISPLLAQTLLNTLAAEGTTPVGTPLWLPFLLVALMALLFWWGMYRNTIPTGAVDTHAHDQHNGHDNPQPEAMHDAAPSVPNDLKIIEGIGPKIEHILHEAGIHTFTILAGASITDLEKIVKHDAGITIAHPDTWPEQAALARDGQWEQLETLQDKLKGGRRV
jgi:predicted flap endonuclease-1-like 5' DNA nuclease